MRIHRFILGFCFLLSGYPLLKGQDFAKEIEAQFWREKIPGLSMVLIKGDSVYFQGAFGYTRQDLYSPVRDSSIFRVGSIGKTVVALGIFRLIQQGQLSLQAEVAPLLPQVPIDNPWQADYPLRLIHLLEHSSGLEGMHYNESLSPTARPSLLAALQQNPNSKQLQWPPGSRPAYSNLNYALLARILENVSGQDFEHYLQTEVLKPLGMKHSGFDLSQIPKNLRPAGFLEREKPAVPDLTYLLAPATSFYSSAADLKQLLLLFLNQGKVRRGDSLLPYLAPPLLQQMQISESSLAARKGFFPGYAKGLFCGYYRGLKKCWHDGSIPGFFGRIVFFPEEKVGYCLLSNRERSWSRSLEKLILDELLGQRRMAMPLESGAAQEVPEGSYLLANPRDRILRVADYLYSWVHVKSGDAGLSLSTPTGENFTFVSSPLPGQYRQLSDPAPELFAGVSEEGRPFIEVQGKYYEKRSYAGAWVFSWLIQLSRWLILPFALFVLGVLAYTSIKQKRVDGLFFSRVLPFLPIPILFLALRIYGGLGFAELGLINPGTVGIFVLSLLAPLTALLALTAQWFTRKKEEFLPLRLFSILGSLLNLAMMVYLFQFDLLGIRLWAY